MSHLFLSRNIEDGHAWTGSSKEGGYDVGGALWSLQAQIGAAVRAEAAQALFDGFATSLRTVVGARMTATQAALLRRRADVKRRRLQQVPQGVGSPDEAPEEEEEEEAAAAAGAVRHSCACIGSPCLRKCVHGASIGGGGGGGGGGEPGAGVE
jgi:hypothetical protein